MRTTDVLVITCCIFSVPISGDLPRVTIATLSAIAPASEASLPINVNGLQQHGPMVEAGMEYLRRTVGNGLTFAENPQRVSVSLYPGSAQVRFFSFVFRQYKWTSVTALIDTFTIDRNTYFRGMNDIFDAAFNGDDPRFRPRGVRYTKFYLADTVAGPRDDVSNSLAKIGQISRIVFLLASAQAGRVIMKTAEAMGMTNGDFVFIMLTLQKQRLGLHGRKDTSWIMSDANPGIDIPYLIYPAKSTMVISFVLPYTDDSVEAVRQRVLEIGPRQFNYTYPKQEVSTLLYPSYEEHVLYGIILNESYTATGRLLDGPDMVKYFLNRTFRLPTSEMYIDENGERMTDILGDVLDNNGTFTTLLKYNHRTDDLEFDDDLVKQYWPGNFWPPPNEPACGFLGNRCSGGNRRDLTLLAGSLGSLIVILSVLSVMTFRHYHAHPELQSTWWAITIGLKEDGRSLDSAWSFKYHASKRSIMATIYDKKPIGKEFT